LSVALYDTEIGMLIQTDKYTGSFWNVYLEKDGENQLNGHWTRRRMRKQKEREMVSRMDE